MDQNRTIVVLTTIVCVAYTLCFTLTPTRVIYLPPHKLLNRKRSPINKAHVLPCNRILLENGTMVGKRWKPGRNCSFHRYTKRELNECIKRRENAPNPDIWFLGDSRMRYQYASFLRMGLNDSSKDMVLTTAWHFKTKASSKSGHRHTTKLWPSSPVYTFATRELIPEMHRDLIQLLAMPEESRPSYLFMGSAVHYPAKYTHCVDVFKSDMKKIIPLIKNITSSDTTKVIWKLEEPVNEQQMIPGYKQTSSLFYELGLAAQNVLNGTGVHIWRSLIPIFMAWQDWRDGIHLGSGSNKEQAMVIANIYCQDIGSSWKP